LVRRPAVLAGSFRALFSVSPYKCWDKTSTRLRRLPSTSLLFHSLILTFDLTESKLHGGRSGVRFPVRTREFSFFRKFETNSGAHSAWYLMCTLVFLRLKRPEREVDYSPPSSEDLNNWWSYASALPIRLCGVYRVNVVFLSLF